MMVTIIHDPHSSTMLHPRLGFSIDPASELALVTDWHVGDLFPDQKRVKFDWSRLCCDVERLKPDPAADARGQGILYTKTIAGSTLRQSVALERAVAIDLYDAHHYELVTAVQAELAAGAEVLLLDVHSYCDVQATLTGGGCEGICPDVCIGFNANVPPPHARAAYELFASAGMSVDFNVPFSGTMMPDPFVTEPRVHGIMLEFHKRLYLRNVATSDLDEEAFARLRAVASEALSAMGKALDCL